MKAWVLGLVASALFGGSQRSDRLRPDVRHWSEDLYQAAPRLEDFEDFLADIDLDEDPEDLLAAQKKLLDEMKSLEAIDLSKESSGRGFLLAKQLVELSFKISTYQRLLAERDLYYKSNQWRLQDPVSVLNLTRQGEFEQTSLKAVGFARNLVNSFTFEPDYSQYLLIRLLARTRNTNLFLFYDQFKKRFQTSPYVPYVNHVIAEYYFQQQEWDKSEALLKIIVDNKDSPIRPYAVYKLAWVHIMRAHAEPKADKKKAQLLKAQTSLSLCLDLMKAWDHHKPVFNVKKEAAIDLAWVHAELRSPKAEVQKYFSDQKLREAYVYYLRYLAVDAVRDGDAKLAEAAFAEFLPMETEARALPQDLMSQIDLFLLTRSFDKVLEGYKKIRALYQEDNDWYKEWHDDKQLMEHSQRQLASHLALMAMKIQQEAEKMGNQSAPESKSKTTGPQTPALTQQQLMGLSRSYYDLFMDWYPESDARDDARYNYALVVFQNGEAERAITLLTQITKDPKSTHRRDAAYSLVLAVASWDAKQPLPKLPASGKATAPVPLTKSKAILVEKIDAFAKGWPEADENVAALYTAAQTMFDFGHYDDASKRFDRIIKMAPKTEQGEASLNTLLSYYVEAGRWTELIPLCKGYLANKEIVAAGHRKIIKQTLDYAKTQVPQ